MPFRDTSTLDSRRLAALPVFESSALKVSDQEGQGCFLDPPGYPSYFLRSVYNRQGDTPDYAPNGVILFGGVHWIVKPAANACRPWTPGQTWETVSAKQEKLLRDLWVPLPYSHPRVQAWISYCYAYFRHCYVDPATADAKADSLITWPSARVFLKAGDKKWQYKRTFCFYDFRSNAANAQEYGKIKAANKAAGKANGELLRYIKAVVADPTNHRAYQFVKSFYPEHEPNLTYIQTPPHWGMGGVGDWWARYDGVNPDNCPKGAPGHPLNAEGRRCIGGWCQFCGGYDTEAFTACLEARKK